MATYFLIQIPAVQTWIVQRASDYLSSELKTKVTISHFNFKPFRSLLLKDLYIEDLDKDTLLYVDELQVKISRISISKQGLDISAIDLKNATIGVKRYNSPREYNFDFIARYFSPTKKDTSATKPWDVTLKNINIENSTLHYQDLKYSDIDSGIDSPLRHQYKKFKNIKSNKVTKQTVEKDINELVTTHIPNHYEKVQMLLSNKYCGFFMIPDDDIWNYNFMGVKHSLGMEYNLKLGIPIEFYNESHRTNHFLTFTNTEDVEQGGEADVDDNFN
jgi:hypothetical protein